MAQISCGERMPAKGLLWRSRIARSSPAISKAAISAGGRVSRMPSHSLGGGFWRVGFCPSGVFENRSPAVVQMDFGCLPRRALVEAFRGRIRSLQKSAMILRETESRRIFGMVKTNWRCGTSWQTAVAIQSAVWRKRRGWQAGQRWRPLEVKTSPDQIPDRSEVRREQALVGSRGVAVGHA
jgi:hypothetical protein